MDRIDDPDLAAPRTASARPWAPVLISCALAALVLVTFWSALLNDFVNFDDNLYCTANPQVLRGLTFEGLAYAWTTTDYGNWTPVTWMSLQVDAALFGVQRDPLRINPVPFHLTNILIHTATTVLMFWWLRGLNSGQGRSALAAALFAVHPLRAESVAWLAERKDVLSLFFLMLTLLAYTRYVARRTPGRYLLVTAAFFLGLASKSMLVTVPLLLMLVDYWPLRRHEDQTLSAPPPPSPATGELAPVELSPFEAALNRWLFLVLEKTPWLVMSLVVGVVAVAAQRQWAAVTHLDALPWGPRLANSVNGLAWYLEKTFWPTQLAAHYPHPMNQVDAGLLIQSALVLVIALGYVAWQGSRAPWLRMGGAWFVIALLPVIGLLQVGTQSWADRYSYLPHVGLVIAIVWEGHRLLSALRVTSYVQATAALPLIGLLSLLSIFQTLNWKDTPTLWKRALAVNEANWFAHAQLGLYELGQNHLPDAEEEFRRASELHPNKADLWADRGLVALSQAQQIPSGDPAQAALRQQRLEEASRHLQQALVLESTHPQAMYNLAMVYKQQGEPGKAIQMLGGYCELHNESSSARVELGRLIARLGRFQDAVPEFQEAIKLDSGNAWAYSNLGLALFELNQSSAARPYLEQALKLSPNDHNTHVDLGKVLIQLREIERAKEHFREALRLDPSDVEAQLQLNALEGK